MLCDMITFVGLSVLVMLPQNSVGMLCKGDAGLTLGAAHLKGNSRVIC